MHPALLSDTGQTLLTEWAFLWKRHINKVPNENYEDASEEEKNAIMF
uniref:Uncharacterized protein n=1 Tax=Anguilla anguilla TaxID=7936 RepID=A0A0E9TNM2_ANGAN